METQLTEKQEQEMREHQERVKNVIFDLMEAFGIDTNIKNIKGFLIDVNASDPSVQPDITVHVKMAAGSDGMAHFVRTFNSKFTIEELVPEHGKTLMNKLEKCNEETHKKSNNA